MLQLFLKTSAISQEDWAKAYSRIVALTAAFPLPLLRIESYNGFQREQDKDYLDLVVNPGSDNEYVAFYGDYMSWTSGMTVRFYKNWDKHCELAVLKNLLDPTKPITWFAPTPFKDDGSLPMTNGQPTAHGYIDTEGALYEYAVIAIAIALENLLPGRAFLVAPDQDIRHVEHVIKWLETHFREDYALPLYFDKKELLASFAQEYADPVHLVERMEHLYRKQFKRNMVFALEYIGFEPTFRFYADVLSQCVPSTFGFYDILQAWIAATQDLERTLHLISANKRLILERGDHERAAHYDLNEVLEKLLDDFVLWTPQQREALDRFYTNKQALETGDENLWGTLLRMAGHRVDICPIVATREELFEAFMYHDPKNGSVFKKTIDTWLEKNADAFEQLMAEVSTTSHASYDIESDQITEDHTDLIENERTREAILLQYPAHERFFIEKAMAVNPAYFDLNEHLEDLYRRIWKTIHESKHLDYVSGIQAESNRAKKTLILHQLKEKRHATTAGCDFERWLAEEEDPNVLLCLFLLLSLKIYDRARAYARYRVLHDRTLWAVWRHGGIYATAQSDLLAQQQPHISHGTDR